MKDELISVILPVRKPNPSQLKECIDSIIEQTYENLEIIIVYEQESDNEDDKFYDLVRTYMDSRIKLLTSSSGISTAKNLAIKNSKGKYVAFIDGDDVCEKERFEKQLKFKKENKCNIVGSWAYNISNEGQIIAKIKYSVEHNEIRKKFMLQNLILNPSVLMDKKIFDDIGLYDPILSGSEDYDIWFRAMRRGYRFGNIPECLIRLRENPNSLTRGKTWRKQRIVSMKVRNKAVFKYGFKKPIDIFFYLLTPLSIFMSPWLLMKFKKMIGWYQE